jgi:hypothetical protein
LTMHLAFEQSHETAASKPPHMQMLQPSLHPCEFAGPESPGLPLFGLYLLLAAIEYGSYSARVAKDIREHYSKR